jgi:hypothetical protein
VSGRSACKLLNELAATTVMSIIEGHAVWMSQLRKLSRLVSQFPKKFRDFPFLQLLNETPEGC